MKTRHWIMAGAAAAIGAALALWLNNDKDGREKPPKGAPQTPLDNPGDQSEFTTSPGEEI